MKKVIISIVLLIALTLNTFAIAYTPSVGKKPGPVIKKDDDNYVGEIINDINKIIKNILDIDLIVTPFSEADGALTKEISEALKKAKEELDSGDLAELIEGIQDVVSKVFPGVRVEDLVVTDIFDMTLINGNNEILETEGNRIRITFDTDYATEPVVALRGKNGAWSAISDEDVTLNDDGSISVIFDRLGVVAFMSPQIINNDPEKKSPKTGSSENLFGIVGLLCVGVVSLAGVEISRRKREE